MKPGFVHLHLHTEYSIVDGIVRIPQLIDAVADAGMPAVAVTDHNNLFSMVRFYRAAIRRGIKPLIGADIAVFNPAEPAQPFRLLLLCQNETGYHNLSALLTRLYREGQTLSQPLIQSEWLEGETDGLIALSGGWQGEIGHILLSARPEMADEALKKWLQWFPDRFYLQVSRTGRAGEENYLHSVVALAGRAGAPVVACNDVRFLHSDDYEAHEARTCINSGRILSDSRRPRIYTDRQYLKTPAEMMELFSDLPEAIENTVAIAQRCNFLLDLGEYHLPDFPVPEGTNLKDWFVSESRKGLEGFFNTCEQYAVELSASREEYYQRLDLEISVIVEMGFAGYFLIVADFIHWAKSKGIPVGPGRGSGAGSLVAFSLAITELDPIKYELLFERFLNPERVSMPDFDIDFCMERRDEVIEYVSQRYGSSHVSQIITFGTMAAKAVVRDVGRVLAFPYGFVDTIAKLIPFELNITLEKALEDDDLKERYNNDDDVKVIIDLAKKLEGITRNAGKHAGGVVIAPKPLMHYMPLYCEKDSPSIVTQCDKDDVETLGLVKFDFLGLRTLTIIDWAVKAAKAGSEKYADLDITRIPLDDPDTFSLLKRCETTAVFQLESRGMKDLIKRLQPDSFDEIIALVALFRPGPLQSGMVDSYVERKHGREKVEYPHPDLGPVLEPTYGVILYQEQVMQIAQILAGYSLGSADILRRAMGKKKPEEMAKQREIFVDGSVERDVIRATAAGIFDLMEKFAGYGFNKSHSAAYALIAYQTAWLKAHQPAAFMSAVLTADMDNTDKIVALIDECTQMNITVKPPDINACSFEFARSDDATILYGLGAVKGVGEAAIEQIVLDRKEHGAFQDLFDFTRRIDARKVNRRAIEALVRCGAMDQMGPGRASLIASLDSALRAADQRNRDNQSGQNDLFGLGGDSDEPQSGQDRFTEAREWHEDQRLAGEMDTLGLYLTGHPISQYDAEIQKLVSCRLSEVRVGRSVEIRICGLVSMVRTMNSRRGPMAFVTLDDKTARLEITVYSDVYRDYRALLTKSRILVIEGTVSIDDRSGNEVMTANRIMELEKARETYGKYLLLELDPAQAGNGMIESLKKTLGPYRQGGLPVSIAYQSEAASARIPLGEKWKIRPANDLLRQLKDLVGENGITTVYP